jgi:hypothetical protein
MWSDRTKKQCVADLQQIALSAASIHASLKFGSLTHEELLERLQDLRQLIDDARCATEADDRANDYASTD